MKVLIDGNRWNISHLNNKMLTSTFQGLSQVNEEFTINVKIMKYEDSDIIHYELGCQLYEVWIGRERRYPEKHQ